MSLSGAAPDSIRAEGEHVVAEVDLARLQPLPLAVVVNPADDLADDFHAGNRFGIIAPRT
jgi:hypothetical protein